MSANKTPIYDQTVEAQGWDPIREKFYPPFANGGAITPYAGKGTTITLSEGQARHISAGRINTYSIRKGGKR